MSAIFTVDQLKPTKDRLYDLFPLHLKKVRAGKPSLHPLRWLRRHSNLFLFLHADLENKGPVGIRFGQDGNLLTYVQTLRDAIKREKYYHTDGHYFGSRYVAELYIASYPAGQDVEKALMDALVEERDAVRIEHPTPVGRVDLISRHELIEVKRACHWKHGLGQLLAYAHFENRPKRILYTFDPFGEPKNLGMAREICTSFNVELVFRRYG